MDRDTASVCGSSLIGEMIYDAISGTTMRCAYRWVRVVEKFGNLGCGDGALLLFFATVATPCITDTVDTGG